MGHVDARAVSEERAGPPVIYTAKCIPCPPNLLLVAAGAGEADAICWACIALRTDQWTSGGGLCSIVPTMCAPRTGPAAPLLLLLGHSGSRDQCPEAPQARHGAFCFMSVIRFWRSPRSVSVMTESSVALK